MISEKGEREEGRKKNILEEPLYANYFAGCLLYLSHVSLKVALVNMHKFLNWSIFCPSSSFFCTSFPYSLCICFLTFGMHWPGSRFWSGPASGRQWNRITRLKQRERERPRCVFLLILSIFPSYVSAYGCFSL